MPPPGQQHLLALAVTQLSMHAFLAGTLLAAYLAAPVASIRPTLVNKRDLPNFQRDQQDATEQLIRADEVVRAHFVPHLIFHLQFQVHLTIIGIERTLW